MALTIDSAEAEKLAKTLAERTGEPLDVAVVTALRERLDRKRTVPRDEQDRLLAVIRDIQERVAALPVLDARAADELIGYNEYGHFD